jgi:hypothetical protein
MDNPGERSEKPSALEMESKRLNEERGFFK